MFEAVKAIFSVGHRSPPDAQMSSSVARFISCLTAGHRRTRHLFPALTSCYSFMALKFKGFGFGWKFQLEIWFDEIDLDRLFPTGTFLNCKDARSVAIWILIGAILALETYANLPQKLMYLRANKLDDRLSTLKKLFTLWSWKNDFHKYDQLVRRSGLFRLPSEVTSYKNSEELYAFLNFSNFLNFLNLKIPNIEILLPANLETKILIWKLFEFKIFFRRIWLKVQLKSYDEQPDLWCLPLLLGAQLPIE